MARPLHHSGVVHEPPHPADPTTHPAGGRLNLLLSDAGWQDESWADHLPRLLSPMGISVTRVNSGHHAARVLQQERVHVAVVDMLLPLDDAPAETPAGGRRLLELLARLPEPPPTVIVKRRRSRRQDTRDLASALEAGVFAVLERPVDLELALETFRRVLRRHYADRWPECGGGT